MSVKRPFELQGHRGARGLRPENTLPSFEAALDAGVSTIETDVHLSADGIPILYHDSLLTSGLCRRRARCPAPAELVDEPLVSSMTLAELRCFVADRNPDRRRFPEQQAVKSPAAVAWAKAQRLPVYALPTLGDLLAFAQEYAGPLGKAVGKSAEQRRRAGRVRFDLELKRVPYHPEIIGDAFLGREPALLEKKVVEAARTADVLTRTTIRSFDHRAVRAARTLSREVQAAVLVADTAVVSPGELARQAGATIYAPDYRFVDPELIRAAHAEKVRVIPWTANHLHDWEKLIAWGVDGLCTDYPDRLAQWLNKHWIEVL